MGTNEDDHDPAVAPTLGAHHPETISTLAATHDSGGGLDLGDIPSIAPALATGTDRYAIGELIGKGGMGEVMLAIDGQIGRDVAIKRMKQRPSAAAYNRFLREARIQGRLDHPAIVPVHELSVDADGRPFFVMKRLTGTTLFDILDQRREGDPFTEERFSRRRLLGAFVDVCLAVEFAHSRGVIHRDLKPANVVLGDFGEVYVLDWGVARVIADAGEGSAGAPGDLDTLGSDEPAASGQTEAGTILGTPGYIPPEQIRGDTGLDARADVFALGCILFEILAGAPLLPRGRSGLTAPFGEIDARPSARTGVADVAPELDEACIAATRADAAGRTASARALGQQVQRYLDGDRDLELREKVAAEHLAAAHAALERGAGEAERAIAMREAGRALALDPTATAAADLVSRLMLEPPAETPKEVEDDIERAEDRDLRTMTRVAVFAYVIYMCFVPVVIWLGVREPWYVGVLAGAIVINAIVAVCVTRQRALVSRSWIYLAVIGNAILIAVWSRLLGPFMVAPGLAAGTIMAFALYPFVRMWWLWAVTCGAALAPWVLEVTGVISRTLSVANGDIVLRMPGVVARMPAIEIALVFYVLALVLITGLMARRLSGSQRAASRKLQVQAWHLKQLVPTSRG
jgi:serine/threonine-protein kinase